MLECCCRKEDGVLRVMEVEFVRITYLLLIIIKKELI